MAFVCKTTRDTNKVGMPTSTTGDHLGPGCYSTSTKWIKSKPSLAPFLSTSGRNNDPQNLVTPGPGSYSTTQLNSYQRQSTIFASRTDRFAESKKDFTPGPGSYSSSVKWTNKPKRRARSSEFARGSQVTWTRMPTAPSIPVNQQSFGYEENEMGMLVRQKPPQMGHTGCEGDIAGPGEYNTDAFTTKVNGKSSSKAFDFGKSRTARVDVNKDQIAFPGPGQYEPGSTISIHTKLIKTKPSSMFASTVKRDKEVKPRAKPENAFMEDAPVDVVDVGPGSYKLNDAFERAKKPIPAHLQCFGSTQSRFTASPNREKQIALSPGPGYYDTFGTSRKPGKSSPQSMLSKPVPFASTTNRFHDLHENSSPAVGQYEIQSFADEIKKNNIPTNSVFGSSTKRFYNPSSDIPGPGEYNEPQPKNRIQNSSVFKSSIKRFDSGPWKKASIAPPPGAYEVSTPMISAKKKGLIDSKVERFQQFLPNKEIPGPGEYDVKISKRMIGGVPSKSQRFQAQSKSSAPGPGAYGSGNAFIKPTFNVAIAEGSLYEI